MVKATIQLFEDLNQHLFMDITNITVASKIDILVRGFKLFLARHFRYSSKTPFKKTTAKFQFLSFKRILYG